MATLLAKRRLSIFAVFLFMICILYYTLNDTFVYNTTMDRQNDVPIPFHVITKPYTNPLVVYNRVSKCGSSTMIWICRQLARRNHFFTRTESMAVMNMSFSETKKISFAKRISLFQQDTIFIRHFHFFDFTKYGGIRPVFINVVRDPVDRFISRFYFKRYGFIERKNVKSKWPRRPFPADLLNLTLEECVLGGVEKCIKTELHKPIFTFFCDDHSSRCRELTPYALNLSKRIAEQHYAAVGLTEDLETTLKVFEALLPKYFKGAVDLLPFNPETARTKAKNRKETSQEVKSVLREALRIEVEFYEFVKERFYRQVHELKKLGMLQ